MTLEVQARELVRAAGRPVPAFRVEGRFGGITTRSWITDVGEVVREESPMGLLVVRETPEQAQTLAVPGAIQADLLEAAALVPATPGGSTTRPPSPASRVRIDGLAGLDPADLAGRRADGDGRRRSRSATRASCVPGPRPAGLALPARPEPFIESDAPEIRAEAEKAAGGAPRPAPARRAARAPRRTPSSRRSPR